MVNKYFSAFLVFITLIFITRVEPADKKSDEPTAEPILFQNHEILNLEIIAPIKLIIRDKSEKPKYHSGYIQYTDPAGNQKKVPVEVRTRGHYRKDPLNCNFPPLMLKFDKKLTKDTIFRHLEKVKLVTHCQTKIKSYQKYLFREYLVYRLNNLLVDTSFKARLALIRYLDSERQGKVLEKYGFFIEPLKVMAMRNDANPFKLITQNTRRIDLETSSTLSLFQFMIGNTDWSFDGEHNIKWIKYKSAGTITPVPYDFDFTGIVHTHYAGPAPGMPIYSIRDRYFRGFCRSIQDFQKIFNKFNQKKADVYSLYNNFPLITRKYRKKTLKFLKKFFKIINSPKLVKRYILEKCVDVKNK